MSKMLCFRTNFQKSPSTGGFSPPPPTPLNLQYLWPEVT